MSCRVVVFDFDGTLVHSNELKRNAYDRIFPGEPEIVAAGLKKNPRESRRGVIRGILLERCPGLENRAEELELRIDHLAREYDRIATDGAATCPEREGATRALRILSERMPLILLSATPQDSLDRIVFRRDWSCYFQDVLGVSVDAKSEYLRRIAERFEVCAEEVLMVGDSPFDREAAVRAGTAYFHMEPDSVLQDVIQVLGVDACP